MPSCHSMGLIFIVERSIPFGVYLWGVWEKANIPHQIVPCLTRWGAFLGASRPHRGWKLL